MFATNFSAGSNNFDFHSRHPARPYIRGIPGARAIHSSMNVIRVIL